MDKQSLSEKITNLIFDKIERGQYKGDGNIEELTRNVLPDALEIASQDKNYMDTVASFSDSAYAVMDIMAPKIEFIKTHKDAQLPSTKRYGAAHGDAAYDLHCVEDVKVPARGSTIAPVGLTVAKMPPNVWFRIEPRSGLGFKSNIQPHLGVIDNQYRGDLGVKLYNFGDEDVTIPKGSGVAQITLQRTQPIKFGFVENISETDRGAKGFGSSDEVVK